MSGQSGLPSSSYSQSSSHLPSRPPILPPPKDVHHYKDWVPSNSKDDGWGRSRPVSHPQDEGEGSHKYTSGYSSQGGRSADQGYPDKRYRNHQRSRDSSPRYAAHPPLNDNRRRRTGSRGRSLSHDDKRTGAAPIIRRAPSPHNSARRDSIDVDHGRMSTAGRLHKSPPPRNPPPASAPPISVRDHPPTRPSSSVPPRLAGSSTSEKPPSPSISPPPPPPSNPPVRISLPQKQASDRIPPSTASSSSVIPPPTVSASFGYSQPIASSSRTNPPPIPTSLREIPPITTPISNFENSPVVLQRQPSPGSSSTKAVPLEYFPNDLFRNIDGMSNDAMLDVGEAEPLSPGSTKQLIQLCIKLTESLESTRRWRTLQSQLEVVESIRDVARTRADYKIVSKDLDETIADKKRETETARKAVERPLLEFAAALKCLLDSALLRRRVANGESVIQSEAIEGKNKGKGKELGPATHVNGNGEDADLDRDKDVDMDSVKAGPSMNADLSDQPETSTGHPGKVDGDGRQQRGRLKRRLGEIDQNIDDMDKRVQTLEEQVLDSIQEMDEWRDLFAPDAFEELKGEIQTLKMQAKKRIKTDTPADETKEASESLQDQARQPVESSVTLTRPDTIPAPIIAGNNTLPEARLTGLETEVASLKAERTSLREEITSMHDTWKVERAEMQKSIQAAVASALQEQLSSIERKIEKVDESVHSSRKEHDMTFDSILADVDSLRKICPVPRKTE